jgi:predicted dinucleotide-binding enzyme
MKYAIIGSGKIGTALARAFARKNIEVAIANTRGPETLASLTGELGRGLAGAFRQLGNTLILTNVSSR